MEFLPQMLQTKQSQLKGRMPSDGFMCNPKGLCRPYSTKMESSACPPGRPCRWFLLDLSYASGCSQVMALPATHIRFALELVDRLPVGSRKAYLAGTMYPDSRWLTGLGREATHADIHLHPGFATSDFRWGWHVHCRCDQIQSALMQQSFPELTAFDDGQRWVYSSALKMIQDSSDLLAVDMAGEMAGLAPVETPNNEDPERINAYYDGVRAIYAGKTQMRPEDYRRLWEMVGLSPERLNAIMRDTAHIVCDGERTERIRGLFPRMCAAFRAPR